MESYVYNTGQLFYNISEKYATHTALKFPGGKEYTYWELNTFSNQLAHFITSQNIKQGNVIAIFNNKSFFSYSLMLACLKTGIIYTNLDSTNPRSRIHKIVGTCKPRAIFYEVTEAALIETLSKEFTSTLLFNIEDTGLQNKVHSFSKNAHPYTDTVTGANPAYIMFTSGSTGFPKGAVMSHGNLLNFINWGQQTFSVTPEDVFTNANPVYFDNSVFDFYTSLFSGATLVPLNSEIVKSPQTLVEAINMSKCTIWFSVPSLLVYLLTTKALKETDFPAIKRIAFGGEGFPKTKLKQLYDMFHKRMELFNVYGPTECTCICSSYIITDRDFNNMTELAPLGHMAPNFGYYILPAEGRENGIGELALSGPCVGLGYYNDPERTAQAFIQHGERYFERIYKTGDLVQKGSDGLIYFKGRTDNQVKHMGYRIELEEVEAAFNSLKYVNEVGVVYEKVSPELGHIKAFVSVNTPGTTSKMILAEVKAVLPPYMVPKIIIILDSLPKNRNGKIDRKQLAELK